MLRGENNWKIDEKLQNWGWSVYKNRDHTGIIIFGSKFLQIIMQENLGRHKKMGRRAYPKIEYIEGILEINIFCKDVSTYIIGLDLLAQMIRVDALFRP